MKIKVLLSVIVLGATLFAACKKSSDETTPAPTPDVTAPVIKVNGSNPVSVSTGTTYTDAGATATDVVDGTVAVTSNKSGTNPNMSVAGTYTITYTASDKAGNSANATRKVVVISGAGYSRADYLWSKSPYGYYVNDSDITTHVNVSTYNGYNIVAGSGANDIRLQWFNGTTTDLLVTVNGAIATLNPTSQTVSGVEIYSGSGILNSAKNMITFSIHNAYDNHDHIMTVYKY